MASRHFTIRYFSGERKIFDYSQPEVPEFYGASKIWRQTPPEPDMASCRKNPLPIEVRSVGVSVSRRERCQSEIQNQQRWRIKPSLRSVQSYPDSPGRMRGRRTVDQWCHSDRRTYGGKVFGCCLQSPRCPDDPRKNLLDFRKSALSITAPPTPNGQREHGFFFDATFPGP